MRDSIGGTATIAIMTVFIVFALSYLAFNVNYTKAFRMKDKIITLYDDFEGECGAKCQDVIVKYAQEIGYSVGDNMNCPSNSNWNYHNIKGIYCEAAVPVSEASETKGDKKAKRYYKIVTKINIQVPVINNLLDLRIFYISGDTPTFTVKE